MFKVIEIVVNLISNSILSNKTKDCDIVIKRNVLTHRVITYVWFGIIKQP